MAALTFPEFSVGAGDLDGDKRHDRPIDPLAMAGQAWVKQGADAARSPLIGVRYGALLKITSTSARSAAPPHIADLAPDAGPATGTPAFANPASLDTLDAAAAYAAVMLDRFAAPPGSPAEAPLASDAPTLDAAAAYAVLTLASFVARPALAPELAAELTSEPEPALMALSERGAADEQVMQLAVLPALGSAAAPAPGIGTGGTAAPNITSQLVARVDGKAAGVVDFQQNAAGLAVRLGSIAQVLSDRFDPAEIARIQASSASNAYLSLMQLQAQGIPISYDPGYDEFSVGHTDTLPKAPG